MNPSTLIARFGTPAYVYELQAVRRAHAALRAALPAPVAIYYSLKANPLVAIGHELAAARCRGEVCSPREVDAALQAGFLPGEMLYNGPGKSKTEIQYAIERDVGAFSVDSPHELRKVGAVAQSMRKTARVLLRVNAETAVPEVALAMTGTPSQFGADARWIARDPEAFAGAPGAGVVGFQCYMGSNLTTVAGVLRAFEIAVRTAMELASRLDINIELLDLGGGFGHPFAVRGGQLDFTSLHQPMAELLDAHVAGWRDASPTVAVESGRYLVAAAGSLLATVEDVKESKGRRFVVLDAGINHLGGMAGLRRVARVGAELVPTERAVEERPKVEMDVVGPLCTPLDYWAHGVEGPALVPGDIVRVDNVGAYGLTASLIAFLGRETPVEIVLDGGDVVEISRLVVSRSFEHKEHSS